MAGIGGMGGGGALDEELQRSNVVRLHGLPFSATEEDVSEFFKGLEMGPDGVVICVNFQGRSTGQAYAQFATTEEANKALERNRQHIGSRYVELSKGHPADMQGALRLVGRGSGTLGGPGGLSNVGIPGMAGNPDMRYTGVVRVRGMPYSCTSTDIMAFFKGIQLAPDGIFLCTHADGRPTGEAYVEFANEEAAVQAMQLNRQPMGSRYVELFRTTKREMMSAVQQRIYGMFSSIGSFSQFGGLAQASGMMGPFGTQGVGGAAANLAAGKLLQTLGDGSENVVIKMRGLPYNASQRDIVDFFEGYEIVPNGIYIVMGGNDRPTGEAFVEFVSPEEARRAMKRHRQSIGSRYIELFRATKSEMLTATSSFGMAHLLDPSLRLLLMRQAAAGSFGGGGLMDSQSPIGWADLQNPVVAAGGFYPREVSRLGGPGSSMAFEPAASRRRDVVRGHQFPGYMA